MSAVASINRVSTSAASGGGSDVARLQQQLKSLQQKLKDVSDSDLDAKSKQTQTQLLQAQIQALQAQIQAAQQRSQAPQAGKAQQATQPSGAAAQTARSSQGLDVYA